MVQVMQRNCVAGDVLGAGPVWMWLVMVALAMPVVGAVYEKVRETAFPML